MSGKNSYPYLSVAGPEAGPSAEDLPKLMPQAEDEAAKVDPRRPGGLCDGVIYMGDGLLPVEVAGQWEARKVSGEAEALRYLRPMGMQWLTMELVRTGNAPRVGVSRPHGVDWLFTAEMHARSKELQRPIRWLFTVDPWCVSEAKWEGMGVGALGQLAGKQVDEERERWRVYRVSDDVWAVIYRQGEK